MSSKLISTDVLVIGGGLAGERAAIEAAAAGHDVLILSLVPPVAEVGIALALQDGAAKYGPFNWRDNSVRARVYIAAMRRHVARWVDGEERAEDSGVHHLDHAMACLAIAGCSEPESITDRTCYEVNIFDQRSDPTYGTGGILWASMTLAPFGASMPSPTAVIRPPSQSTSARSVRSALTTVPPLMSTVIGTSLRRSSR